MEKEIIVIIYNLKIQKKVVYKIILGNSATVFCDGKLLGIDNKLLNDLYNILIGVPNSTKILNIGYEVTIKYNDTETSYYLQNALRIELLENLIRRINYGE